MPVITYDPLRCGDCGCETFTLQHKYKDRATHVGGAVDDTVEGCLVATCTQCKKHSVITVSQPTLRVHGHLCGGWAG